MQHTLAPSFEGMGCHIYFQSCTIPHLQDEIDTHKLDREAEGLGMNMINPGDLDAMQMRNMGVQGF